MMGVAKGVEEGIKKSSYKLTSAEARRVGFSLHGPIQVDITGLDAPKLACGNKPAGTHLGETKGPAK